VETRLSTVMRPEKRDGAKAESSGKLQLRYVPGQGRCAFQARNPGHRPRRPAHGGQAKVYNFLHQVR